MLRQEMYDRQLMLHYNTRRAQSIDRRSQDEGHDIEGKETTEKNEEDKQDTRAQKPRRDHELHKTRRLTPTNKAHRPSILVCPGRSIVNPGLESLEAPGTNLVTAPHSGHTTVVGDADGPINAPHFTSAQCALKARGMPASKHRFRRRARTLGSRKGARRSRSSRVRGQQCIRVLWRGWGKGEVEVARRVRHHLQ